MMQGSHLIVRRQSQLSRVLGFSGKTIDDVVNCPVAKSIVRQFFVMSREIDRRIEVAELEKQWNPLGVMGR